ncbi:uncharacterized protein BDV17DRAFT_290255 [Aspergillus undulatus]|uniref:uncharacterized protein n=1 Tax=Aspergillus undulatus TaxID=1810928 RepID=UPI003CCE0B16
MSATNFLPFAWVVSSNIERAAKERCFAYANDGDRCENTVRGIDLTIFRQNNQDTDPDVEDDDDGDDEGCHRDNDRTALVMLARSALCGAAGHDTEQNVGRAVQQWEQERLATQLQGQLQGDADASSSSSLPLPAQDYEPPVEQDELVFEIAKGSANVKPKDTDEKVLGILEKNQSSHRTGTNDTDLKHIYLVGHERANGLYKIGHKAKRSDNFSNKACYEPGWDCSHTVRTGNANLIQSLVLAEFMPHGRVHKCANSACGRKTHVNWIEAAFEDFEASINAWHLLIHEGYAGVGLPKPGFSGDTNRWTKWARETAAAQQSLKSAARASVPAPTLPTQPAPIAHGIPYPSFASTVTLSTEAPPPTPTTPPVMHNGPLTPPSTASDRTFSTDRVRFKDILRDSEEYVKGKLDSILKSSKKLRMQMGTRLRAR